MTASRRRSTPRRSPGRFRTTCRKHDLLEADRPIVTALRLPRLARVLCRGRVIAVHSRQRSRRRSSCPGRWTAPTVSTRTRLPPRAPPGTACSSWARTWTPCALPPWRAATASCCAGTGRACTWTAAARSWWARTAWTRRRDAGGCRGRALPRRCARRRAPMSERLLERLCVIVGRPVVRRLACRRAPPRAAAADLGCTDVAVRALGGRPLRACGRRNRGSSSSRGCRCRGKSARRACCRG